MSPQGRDSALPVWHLRPRPRRNLPLPPALESSSPLRHLPPLHLGHSPPFWKRKEERYCCNRPTLRWHCCLCCGTPCSLGNCCREHISQCHNLCMATSPIPPGEFPPTTQSILCKGWAWGGGLPALPPGETSPPWYCRPFRLFSPALACAHLFR